MEAGADRDDARRRAMSSATRDVERVAAPTGSAVLRLAGVEKSFGRTQIIRGVDLDLVQGERHALIGP
jgi:ATPase subunit of ABC transporter with duplicated ATPase domains